MAEKDFHFYYNRKESELKGKPQIIVRYEGECHIVDNVVCHVSTEGMIRKKQPKFVMKGKCQEIIFENNIAWIR